jgi:thiol-disulfide isomerase/thioredoxin
LGGFLLGGLFGFYLLRENAQTGARGSSAVQALPPTVGSLAPEFTLYDLDGGSRALSSFKGRPVVINFWATWCPPCKEEMPLFERYSRKYAGELVFLGIDSAEKAEIVRPFVAKMDITFPILLDQSGMVSDLYFVKDFPYTFFVDENGTLRGQHIGLMTEEKLVKYLDTIGIEP